MKIILDIQGRMYVRVEYSHIKGRCPTCRREGELPGILLEVRTIGKNASTIICAADAEKLGAELIQLAARAREELRQSRKQPLNPPAPNIAKSLE